MNAKINLDKMELYLTDKNIEVTESLEEPHVSIKKVTWQEKDRALWAGGAPPKIEVRFASRLHAHLRNLASLFVCGYMTHFCAVCAQLALDTQYGFLLSVVFHLDKKRSELNEEGLMRILTAILAGVCAREQMQALLYGTSCMMHIETHTCNTHVYNVDLLFCRAWYPRRLRASNHALLSAAAARGQEVDP